MANELVKPGAPFRPGVKLVGLAAKRAAQLEKEAAAPNAPPKLIAPADALHKIGIIFDDSGSMGGEAIKNARKGVEEFLRSCTPNQTAVAIYPMNAPALLLSSDLPAVAMLVQSIEATGGTYPTDQINNAFADFKPTRLIVFSDGSPSSENNASSNSYAAAIRTANEREIPIDTVYIGPKSPGLEDSLYNPEFYMKEIARKTNGVYLHFDPAKSNFATAFKYLSPGSRHMLADKSFVSKLENGGV